MVFLITLANSLNSATIFTYYKEQIYSIKTLVASMGWITPKLRNK